MGPIKIMMSAWLAAMLASAAVAQEASEPTKEDAPSAEAKSDAQPSEAVKQFDADGDGKLNDDEFGKAREFVRGLREAFAERMGDRGGRRWREGRPGSRPEGPELGPPHREGDEPGPPPHRERRFHRGPDGPGDHDGPPRRPGRGPGRDDDGPRDRRFGRGPDGRPGPPGFGPPGPPPDPRALFAEFDENKDGQLSPEEFAKGIETMHQRRMRREGPMAGRRGPEGRGERGRRGRPEGRGGREGGRPDRPPVEGDEAPPWEGEDAEGAAKESTT